MFNCACILYKILQEVCKNLHELQHDCVMEVCTKFYMHFPKKCVFILCNIQNFLQVLVITFFIFFSKKSLKYFI